MGITDQLYEIFSPLEDLSDEWDIKGYWLFVFTGLLLLSIFLVIRLFTKA
jgi:hypothetical protein